jgi:hypothetical protein
MNNGLWIGAVVLALLARGTDLIAEESPWRAVESPPSTASSEVTLGRPVPLKAPARTETAPPAPLPGPLVLVNFETTDSPVEPASQPTPEIIAVSAPVPLPMPPPPPDSDDGEPTETLFAIDRSVRPVGMTGPPRPAARPITPTAAFYGEWNAPPTLPPVVEAVDPLADPLAGPLNQRLYVSGEYLLWWLRGDSVPILATTSAPADFGVLGAPTTSVLLGGNSINSGPFSGGRFMAGYWLDCCGAKAIEVGGFFLGQRSANFSVNSFTNPVIARPFQEVNNNQETAQLTALPGVSTGALTINSPTELWGLEANLRCLLCCGCNYRITALAGFRNLNLNESLTITENVQGLGTAPPPFTSEGITVFDRFATQNHFYGGQIGADARWYWGRLSIDVRGKIALGGTTQQLDINGGQQFVSPQGVVQNFTGGLLALPSNIGRFTHNAFSVVPEVGVNLGYQITPNLRGFVAYNFLYWNNVIRPGTSIDRGLDVTQIPNFPLSPEPAPVPGKHPAPVFHETDIWAQGISFGLEFLY